MPLCARCTGIYIGVFLAFCYLFLRKRMAGNRPFSMGEAVLTGGAILLVGVDGVGSYLGAWESSQLSRILTGSLVGAVVPAFLLLAVNFDPVGKNELPLYEKPTELPLLLLASAGFGLLLWGGLPLAGIGAVLSVAGEVLLWGGLVWLVLKNLLGRRRLPYWRLSLLSSFVLLFLIGGMVA